MPEETVSQAIPDMGALFNLWGSDPELAAAVNLNTQQVRKWRQRGRIPSEHWPVVVKAVQQKTQAFTADDMLRLHDFH